MTKKYDTIVYIGRFQGPHNGHLETIETALALAQQVIVIIGSADMPSTVKNPFSVAERATMIQDALEERGAEWQRVDYGPVEDNMYNDQAWAAGVQRRVKLIQSFGKNANIGLIGFEKDESSFYLKMFPQWTFLPVNEVEPLNATDIRAILFGQNPNLNYLKGVMAASTIEYLRSFMKTDRYKLLCQEAEFIAKYKKQYEMFPYPPVFVTVDAVVTCAGHVLLVERAAMPGKGNDALPGGFFDALSDKNIVSATLRELDEETRIKVPLKVLQGSIKSQHVFDAMGRSTRGRTITHASHIDLPLIDGKLPKVKGDEDVDGGVSAAKWVPFANVKRSNMYEDHYDIIVHFVGSLK